jgi:hypothetical protein
MPLILSEYLVVFRSGDFYLILLSSYGRLLLMSLFKLSMTM